MINHLFLSLWCGAPQANHGFTLEPPANALPGGSRGRMAGWDHPTYPVATFDPKNAEKFQKPPNFGTCRLHSALIGISFHNILIIMII
jgi:hypothetical protein